jgi:hypothetical protein
MMGISGTDWAATPCRRTKADRQDKQDNQDKQENRDNQDPATETSKQANKQTHKQTQGTGKVKGKWLDNERFTTYGGALHKDHCNANNKQMNKAQDTEAQVKDNDLATDNFLVGGWGEGKG